MSRPPNNHVRYFIISVLFLTSTVNYADRASLSISKTGLSKEFGLDPAAFGWLLSAWVWSYVIAQIPAGWLLDRFGSKRVYGTGIFLWSLFIFLMGFTGYLPARVAFPALFGLLFLAGFALAPAFPGNGRFVAAWFPTSERGTASAIFNSSQYFSLVLFAPFMGWLAQDYGWRYVFWAMGALGFVLTAVWFKTVHSPANHPALSPAELDYIKQGGGLVNMDAPQTAGGSDSAKLRLGTSPSPPQDCGGEGRGEEVRLLDQQTPPKNRRNELPPLPNPLLHNPVEERESKRPAVSGLEAQSLIQGNPVLSAVSRRSSVKWSHLKQLLTSRMLAGVYLGQYCITTLTYFFIQWFPGYLEHRGMSVLKVGFVAALPALCGCAGGISGGKFSDLLLKRGCSLTFARKLPIVLGMFLSCVMIVCNYVQTNWIAVAVMCVAFFGKGFGALGWTVVSDTSPKEIIGLSGGLFNTFGNTAAITTAVIIGYLVKGSGGFAAALVFVGANAIGAILCYLLLVGEIKRLELRP